MPNVISLPRETAPESSLDSSTSSNTTLAVCSQVISLINELEQLVGDRSKEGWHLPIKDKLCVANEVLDREIAQEKLVYSEWLLLARRLQAVQDVLMDAGLW